MLYLQDCAQQAGQESRFIYIEDLGLGVGGVLTDLDDMSSSVHLSCIR
ncbi:glutathionylspermidine synthase YjfC [Escherichia coli]|uniref:Glutathionylspermidine synthase YjfC n=1 Tax=Escherichia coli TaxID=562 RepID=A0A376MPA5_ECOLX|nr:glutathionylspermidine synthase YjfC [Escherichia coli]